MAKRKVTSDTEAAAGETAADPSSPAATDPPRAPKRRKRKKKRAGKKVAATAPAGNQKAVVKRKKKSAAGRPKKGGPNKSKAIRDYLAAHKNAGLSEVVAALKQDGIEVTTAFVSNIKSKSKLTRATKKVKRGRPVGSGGSDSISLSALLDAKKLVEQVGGVDNAVEAVAALKRLL